MSLYKKSAYDLAEMVAKGKYPRLVDMGHVHGVFVMTFELEDDPEFIVSVSNLYEMVNEKEEKT